MIRGEVGVPTHCAAAPVSDSSNRLDGSHFSSAGEDKAPMTVYSDIDTAILNSPQPSSGSSSRTWESSSTRPIIISDAESPSPGVPPVQPYHGMPAEPLPLSSLRFGGNIRVIVRSSSPAASVPNSSNGLDWCLPSSCRKRRSKRHYSEMLLQERPLEGGGGGDGSKESSKRAAISPPLPLIPSSSPHASPVDAVQATAQANKHQLHPLCSGSSNSHPQRCIPPDVPFLQQDSLQQVPEVYRSLCTPRDLAEILTQPWVVKLKQVQSQALQVLAEDLRLSVETALSGMESSHKSALEKAIRTPNRETESFRDKHLKEIDDLKRSHKDVLDHLSSQLAAAMQADSAHQKQVDDLNRANTILNQEMESLRDKHQKEVGDLKRSHKDALDRLRSRLAAMAGDPSRLKKAGDLNR